jgi:GTPase SAR1 family protein
MRFDDQPKTPITPSSCATNVTITTGAVHLQIWDAASERPWRVIPLYTRNAAASLPVFDVSRPENFRHQDTWLETVSRHCEASCMVFIVANKRNLPWKVSKSEIQNWWTTKKIRLFFISEKSVIDVTALVSEVAPRKGVRPRSHEPGRNSRWVLRG